nr:MAG TPA: hypothetical protein [Caudoviricetes sp.]
MNKLKNPSLINNRRSQDGIPFGIPSSFTLLVVYNSRTNDVL